MRISRLAWLGLLRRPAAALLTVLGVGLITGLGGMVSRVADRLDDRLHEVDPSVDVIIAPKSSALNHYLNALSLEGPIPTDLVQRASAMDALADDVQPYHAMPIAWFARSQTTPVVGVAESWWRRRASLASPVLARGRRPNRAGEVVLGTEAAKTLGIGKGETVDLQALWRHPDTLRPVWEGQATVVGLLDEMGHAWDRAMIADISWAQEAYQAARQAGPLPTKDGEGISHILVALGREPAAARAALFDSFHVRRVEQVVEVDRTREAMRQWMQAGLQIKHILLATLAVVGVGIMGGLLVERQHSLRPHMLLLRALGYRRIEIGALLWLQGMALLLGGGAVGMGLEIALEVPILTWLELPVPHTWWPTTGHHVLWSTLGASIALASLSPWLWSTERLRAPIS